MDVTIKYELVMGHKLHGYVGNCANLHGHNYILEATFRSERLNDIGFVEDFGPLKRIVKQTLFMFDHTMVLHHEDPDAPLLRGTPNRLITLSVNPTAEHLAQLWFRLIYARAPQLVRLQVWETSNCSAIAENSDSSGLIREWLNV
jgi:6-pyruvoyltetrahydropterin/6-carboxytetrahydropterin synthase